MTCILILLVEQLPVTLPQWVIQFGTMEMAGTVPPIICMAVIRRKEYPSNAYRETGERARLANRIPENAIHMPSHMQVCVHYAHAPCMYEFRYVVRNSISGRGRILHSQYSV